MFGITEVGEDEPLAVQKATVRKKKGRKGTGEHHTGILPIPPRFRQHEKAYSETWVHEAVKAPELCMVALFMR